MFPEIGLLEKQKFVNKRKAVVDIEAAKHMFPLHYLNLNKCNVKVYSSLRNAIATLWKVNIPHFEIEIETHKPISTL